MASRHCAPLLRCWSKHVKSGLLHAISLAAMALTIARSRRARSRLQTELDRANGEIDLLKEELAIKDARWGRLPSRRRPHFTPIQRMRILQLKATRGWSCEQAARAFMIDELTKRLVERALEGEMTHHLGYPPHSPAGQHTGNSRNGKTHKTVKGKTGEMETLRASIVGTEPTKEKRLTKDFEENWDQHRGSFPTGGATR